MSGVLFVLNSQSTNFIFSSDRILDIIIKCFFVSNLFLISLIDIDTLTIPNKLNIFNYVLGFIIILFFSDSPFNFNIIFSRFLFSILTILSLELFSYLYFVIRGKSPLDQETPKLLSVFVIWLGIKGDANSTYWFYISSRYLYFHKIRNEAV